MRARLASRLAGSLRYLFIIGAGAIDGRDLKMATGLVAPPREDRWVIICRTGVEIAADHNRDAVSKRAPASPIHSWSGSVSARPLNTVPRLVVVAAKQRCSRSRLTVCWFWVNVYPMSRAHSAYAA